MKKYDLFLFDADIARGNNAGIDTCWFNMDRNYNQTGIIPTYEVSRLHEVFQFVI